MFFAIVDRDRVALSVTNACARLVDETGTVHGPFYVFSVTQAALPLQPWRTGTVYLLPRESFITQPPLAYGTNEALIAQFASLTPVPPLAKLTVTPTDFPFLAQIRGHDDQRLAEYATALQTGAAGPNDPSCARVSTQGQILDRDPMIPTSAKAEKKVENRRRKREERL